MSGYFIFAHAESFIDGVGFYFGFVTEELIFHNFEYQLLVIARRRGEEDGAYFHARDESLKGIFQSVRVVGYYVSVESKYVLPLQRTKGVVRRAFFIFCNVEGCGFAV